MAPRVVSVISNFYLGLLRVSKPDTFVDHKFEKYEPISKKTSTTNPKPYRVDYNSTAFTLTFSTSTITRVTD